jgi:hypothetical protein
MKNIRIKKIYSSRNLKLKDNDSLSKTKLHEIYSLIGNSKTNNGKLSLIRNNPPQHYTIITHTQLKSPKYTSSITLSNRETRTNDKFQSFSEEKINKNTNFKKNNKIKSYNNFFKPLTEQTLNKMTLNKKPNRKIPFNKAYFKGELQNLNYLLFGYNRNKHHKRVISNYLQDDKSEDDFYSDNNLILNKQERISSLGNIQLQNLLNLK